MKDRLSNLIIDFHPNRTIGSVCSKLRQSESLVPHSIDKKKTKILSALSNREKKNKNFFSLPSPYRDLETDTHTQKPTKTFKCLLRFHPSFYFVLAPFATTVLNMFLFFAFLWISLLSCMKNLVKKRNVVNFLV